MNIITEVIKRNRDTSTEKRFTKVVERLVFHFRQIGGDLKPE